MYHYWHNWSADAGVFAARTQIEQWRGRWETGTQNSKVQTHNMVIIKSCLVVAWHSWGGYFTSLILQALELLPGKRSELRLAQLVSTLSDLSQGPTPCLIHTQEELWRWLIWDGACRLIISPHRWGYTGGSWSQGQSFIITNISNLQTWITVQYRDQDQLLLHDSMWCSGISVLWMKMAYFLSWLEPRRIIFLYILFGLDNKPYRLTECALDPLHIAFVILILNFIAWKLGFTQQFLQLLNITHFMACIYKVNWQQRLMFSRKRIPDIENVHVYRIFWFCLQ